jgi:hypothetical protein
MILLLALVFCWLHCVLTQPLQAAQHTALMSVYDSLGVSAHPAVVCVSSQFVFPRMQRHGVPAIRCVVELHWLGIVLCVWQCHSVVRSRPERSVVRDGVLSLQDRVQHQDDGINSADDWAIDVAHSIVRHRYWAVTVA